MGSWGTGILQDDQARDLADLYTELVSLGFDDEDVLDELTTEYGQVGGMEPSTFWIALALVQHRLGRLGDTVRARAVDRIDSGRALQAWIDLVPPGSPSIASRQRALEKARASILSPQARRRTPRPSREVLARVDRTYPSFPWAVDRTYAYRTRQGDHVVFVVTDLRDDVLQRHYATEGGRLVRAGRPVLRQPFLLLMDYRGTAPPTAAEAARLEPYVAPSTAAECEACRAAIEALVTGCREDMSIGFETFAAQDRLRDPTASEEVTRRRHHAYVQRLVDLQARYADRDAALKRHFYKRFMMDPRVPVPEERLTDLEVSRHVEREELCVAATWATLDARIEQLALGAAPRRPREGNPEGRPG